ncbi:MAG: pseudouridine synthase, partial [Syntrophomonadaceae bacterium]|nr:pseudouridine synthase [Syntrophomonadaceae bacterium]
NELVTELGYKVEVQDLVELDGQRLQSEAKIYIMLNKPSGYISSVGDMHSRPTVIDLLGGINERIYPVGRLDLDTEGLLLLSNDGDFCNKMIHPRYGISKKYEAWVIGRVENHSLRQLEQGVTLDDGLTSPARVRVLDLKADMTLLELEIHEGRKRQVKRMCLAVGHKVIKLKRTSLAFLELKDLELGKYRHLTAAEVDRLKQTGCPTNINNRM